MSRRLGVAESRKYAREAVRGLLAIGADSDHPVEHRIHAFEMVLGCTGEDLTPPAVNAVGFHGKEE